MNTLDELEMNNLNKNYVNILDLPDEILLIILKKLNMVDVLYSLIDVNRRFHRLSLDSFHIDDLNMTNNMTIDSLYNQISSIDNQILSKICEQILVRIHDQVHKLTVEEYSMKTVLAAGDYPQLYSLSLLNFKAETIHQYLTDDLILRNLLSRQITHVNIGIQIDYNWSRTVSSILSLILSLCEKLTVFNIGNIFPRSKCWVPVFHSVERCMSSTLIKLKVNVTTFVDCLYLLDGRLDSLSTLIINVEQIFESAFDFVEKKNLPKLKCFSFTTFTRTEYYDKLIVPLLCRMINLEELKLYIPVFRRNSTFIDGIQLYDQFLFYMTKLKKFALNIDTKVSNMKKEIQSNEDIQRSFIGRLYEQVASYINTYSCKKNSSTTKEPGTQSDFFSEEDRRTKKVLFDL